jgi:hypothetical protein
LLLVGSLVGCGASPHLQRQESHTLAITCASLRERDGDKVVSMPARGFLLPFLSSPPTGDSGLLTKDEMVRVCESTSPATSVAPAPTSTPTAPRRP